MPCALALACITLDSNFLLPLPRFTLPHPHTPGALPFPCPHPLYLTPYPLVLGLTISPPLTFQFPFPWLFGLWQAGVYLTCCLVALCVDLTPRFDSPQPWFPTPACWLLVSQFPAQFPVWVPQLSFCVPFDAFPSFIASQPWLG